MGTSLELLEGKEEKIEEEKKGKKGEKQRGREVKRRTYIHEGRGKLRFSREKSKEEG